MPVAGTSSGSLEDVTGGTYPYRIWNGFKEGDGLMAADHQAGRTGATCGKCGLAIRRNHHGTWIHVDPAGRRLHGLGHGASGPCRTPDKRVYPSRRAAATELESFRQGLIFTTGRPYHCAPCKGWHITSAPTTRTGRRGAAHGSLVGNPVLRDHLNRLGREHRKVPPEQSMS